MVGQGQGQGQGTKEEEAEEDSDSMVVFEVVFEAIHRSAMSSVNRAVDSSCCSGLSCGGNSGHGSNSMRIESCKVVYVPSSWMSRGNRMMDITYVSLV